MNPIERLLTENPKTFKAIGGFMVLITFFMTADNYISDKIDDRIKDADYIQSLAKVLRPFSLADENGNITYDHGGEKFIKDISVTEDKHGNLKEVTIITKSYLQHAPTLTIIDFVNYQYKVERTGSYEWKYSLYSLNVTIMESRIPSYKPTMIIEILK